jgi:DNA topoisomerase-1
LRRRHAVIEGGRIRLSFRGKSGIWHEGQITDRRLVRIIGNCRDLPGYRLFQYVDEAGERHVLDSAAVNLYLREITGADITAKDFRTWAGTCSAATALQQLSSAGEPIATKTTIVRAVEEVARRLRNTPAVCRKCYIHPAILEGYLDGTLLRALRRRVQVHPTRNAAMTPDETAVARFLRRRLAASDRRNSNNGNPQ